MARVRHVTDDERRARLAVRHGIAPGFRVGSPEAATRAVTVLHATEPATVYLSCVARVDGLTRAGIDDALYADRRIVKQLAMRRTLFVFPRDLLPAVWPSASARVAATQRTQIVKHTVASGLAADGHEWLDNAAAEVVDALAAAPDGLTSQEIRQAVPAIDVKVTVQGFEVPHAPQVILYAGLTGDIVRGTNAGGWYVSRPRWTLMRHWLGDVPEHWTPHDGYRELVRRWLCSFGPGTEDDLVWWLGATKAVVRKALTDLDAVQVTLDGGGTGFLLPDDLDEVPDPGPWAALLPVLDPTTMGWQARDFYLGPHKAKLFDRNGNAGTTAWVDGRVVGCWVQDDAGVVEVRLLEPVTARAKRLLDAEAARLTAWLDGHRVGAVYKSPLMK